MIEAPSHLIALPGGAVRVLRLSYDALDVWFLSYTVRRDRAMCRVCGCTNRIACMGGCSWVTAACDLCSRCLEEVMLANG